MRRGRTLLVAVGMLLATASVLAPPAAALNRVVGDCYAHSTLTKHYTVKQLQQALNQIPTDIAEYTNCPDVIREQLDKQLGVGLRGGSGGGGSSFLPVWLIVVIVLIVVGGGGAALAARRRSAGGGGEAPPRSDVE